MIARREFLSGAAAMLAPSGYRILDPHVHVWKRSTTPAIVDDATPEMLLEEMDAHGVEKTVLVQVIYYRWDNTYTLECLRKYPKRFIAVARVDPQSPTSPDHLSELVEQGFRGVRLSPGADAASDWIRGPLMPPLWKRCNDLKVPMQILAPISRMPDIGALAEKSPSLTIIIDHMADCPIDQPRELEKLIALKRYPRVFVKVSHTWSLSKQAYPWLDSQQYVKRLYDAFGPQRLMWGTDWPMVKRHATYAQALSVVRDDMPFLNADDKRWLLGKTVERVWPGI